MKRELNTFFTSIRRSLYGGKIPAGAVSGHEAILDGWDRLQPAGDRRQLAYVLATAFHETGGHMQPVDENLNYSAAGLRRTFPRYFSEEEAKASARQPEAIANRAYAGRMGNGDAESGDGYRFRGRGLVQITGRANYRAYGIEERPEAAMQPETAVTILIDGMLSGSFTGKRLADFFDGSRADWVGARRIVNGTDRAADVARYARLYAMALSAAEAGDAAWA